MKSGLMGYKGFLAGEDIRTISRKLNEGKGKNEVEEMGYKIKVRNWLSTGIILMFCLFETTARGVTIPYMFVRDESTVHRSSRPAALKYFIEGQFLLNVDFNAGIASFDQVDATLSGEILYYDYDEDDFLFTKSLNVLFELTELKSTAVSDTQIDFLLERNIPPFPYADIHLTVTFVDDSLEMSGYFGTPVFDGPSYSLDAFAVPEPGTLLLLVLGGMMLRKRK